MFCVSVTDYGAIPGVEALQTAAIQKAIDAAFLAGGGEVQIPKGHFRTGGIRLRSNVTLHLLEEAHLEASQNPEDYMYHLTDTVEPLPEVDFSMSAPLSSRWEGNAITENCKPTSRWNNGFIQVMHAENVAIIGEKGSVINGRDCYDELGEEKWRGPHCIHMWDCHNVTLKGYTIFNSANWAHCLFGCSQVFLSHVTVNGGHDGSHFRNCRNVCVYDCEFHCGDDCVAGFANVNVHVRNCILNSTCSGLRLGATNALIEKCHFYGPGKYMFRNRLTPEEKKACTPSYTQENDPLLGIANRRYNMLSAVTYFAARSHDIPTLPGNMVVQDCTVENTDRFLHFNFSGNEQWQCGAPLHDFTFRNIQASGILMPLTAYGSAEVPFNLTMENVKLGFREGNEVQHVIQAANCERIVLRNMEVTGFAGDCVIRQWEDIEDIVFDDFRCNVPETDWVKPATEEFYTKPV